MIGTHLLYTEVIKIDVNQRHITKNLQHINYTFKSYIFLVQLNLVTFMDHNYNR
jgi:hypothetical protein